MRLLSTLLLTLVLSPILQASADPIAVSQANPHYFARNGKPIVLVSSDHHYGAVIDLDFDYAAFLDTLAANGMNLTRIYPGGMFEPPDKYAPGNPLGPLPGRHLLPWARTTTPGAHPSLAAPGQPSMKFDLDSWNPAYFVRLKAFVQYAAQKGIVVEVAFFNGMYADGWPLMPFYHTNNIQGVGTYEAAECGLFTTDDPRNQDVIRYQKAYVAKVATELNGLDNVIFDLSDEPLLQGNPDGGITIMKDGPVVPWLHAMRDAFLAAVAKLPKKHVLGQTVQSLSPDLSLEPWCQWLPTEYVKAARNALEKNYGARKPIVDVESDYFGVGLVKPYVADDVRLEGWWFLLGGGAGIINLNSEYHRGQPSGGSDTRERILPQRRVLKTFMESLDLKTIARFEGVKNVPAGVVVSALATPGRQYAAYMFHGGDDKDWGAHFVGVSGQYHDQITLAAVPAGHYRLEWIDPTTGQTVRSDIVNVSGGDFVVSTPPYALDIAMRMTKAH